VVADEASQQRTSREVVRGELGVFLNAKYGKHSEGEVAMNLKNPTRGWTKRG